MKYIKSRGLKSKLIFMQILLQCGIIRLNKQQSICIILFINIFVVFPFQNSKAYKNNWSSVHVWKLAQKIVKNEHIQQPKFRSASILMKSVTEIMRTHCYLNPQIRALDWAASLFTHAIFLLFFLTPYPVNASLPRGHQYTDIWKENLGTQPGVHFIEVVRLA